MIQFFPTVSSLIAEPHRIRCLSKYLGLLPQKLFPIGLPLIPSLLTASPSSRRIVVLRRQSTTRTGPGLSVRLHPPLPALRHRISLILPLLRSHRRVLLLTALRSLLLHPLFPLLPRRDAAPGPGVSPPVWASGLNPQPRYQRIQPRRRHGSRCSARLTNIYG